MADEIQGVRKALEMGERSNFQEIVKTNLYGWNFKAQRGLFQKEINYNLKHRLHALRGDYKSSQEDLRCIQIP